LSKDRGKENPPRVRERVPFDSPLAAMRCGLVLHHLQGCWRQELDLHCEETVPSLRRRLGRRAAQIEQAIDDWCRAGLAALAVRSWGNIYVILSPKGAGVDVAHGS